ncbi:MAG: hypothetical protein ACRDRY_22685 [Pseudonocardiaceae bacterium]
MSNEVPSHASEGSDAHTGDGDLVERVRRLVTDAQTEGQSLGRRAVAKQLNVSEYRAWALLEAVGVTTGLALNGTSGPRRSPA